MRGLIAIAGFLIVTAAPVARLEAQSSTPADNQTPPPATTAPRPKPAKPASKPAPSRDDSVPDAPAAGNAAPEPSASSPGGSAASTEQPATTVAPAAQPPADPSGTDTPPAASQAPVQKHSPSQDNPFPEEDSKAAAKDEDSTGASDQQPASTADQASRPAAGGGSTGSSSSQQGLDKLDLYGDKSKKGRNADPDAGLAYDPKLAKQDDKIGDFYMKNGNAPGAYARYKEASQHDAGDADAIFGMAEAARQMNMRDEAAADYQTYLFAFPDGAKAHNAKKALAELKLQSKR